MGGIFIVTRKEDINQIIKEVNKYREEEKLAFFVGAGVSKMSGCPSWSELVLSMAEEIGYESYKVDKSGNPILSSEELLKIPQMYFNEKKELAYLEKVKKQLDVKRKPNDIHKLIMRLNPYHLLTTNYDDLLEQSANMFSINYSVINSDKKVSETSTQRYILKVHGDFENNNFVLKESDYLNYEYNFKLMDNLVKTIMATNMIIFIGYQLNDYNIKLILNWVQNVQGNSFIKPVFIYTDPDELDNISIDYYKERGLRIICAYDLCKKGDYFDRYKAVLERLLFYVEEPTDNTIESIIDYLYGKIFPLDEVQYLRANDFIGMFEGQSIDKINMINRNKQNPVFAMFYEAYDKKENLSPVYLNKAEYIMQRITLSGIIGCYTNGKTYIDMRHLKIWDNVFYENYEEIESNIGSYGYSIGELYNRAYDLCMFGRLEEAYYIYIDLLTKCREEKRWMYYFFTQINLKFLSQLIRQINEITNGLHGITYFGKKLELFEPKLLDDIGLIQAYTDLPAEIRKYSFLKKLAANNYYSEDIVKLYEENYKISLDISVNNVTLFGAASYDHSEILFKDAVNFIYNNRIIFSVFSEHKRFVRTSMHTYLKGKAERMNIVPHNKKFIREEKFELTCQDILLLLKNFKFKELQFLTKEIDLRKFVVDCTERKKFEKYVENIISFYMNNFNGSVDGDRINMYILIKDEIKSMCYLALYFIENKEVLKKYINFFMESMPEQELDYKERLWVLDLISPNKSDIDETIKNVMENLLIKKVQFCMKNSNQNLLQHWKGIMKMYSNWLSEKYPDFKSKKLTQIFYNGEFTNDEIIFLENLLPIIEEV